MASLSLIAALPDLTAHIKLMADNNNELPPDYFKLWKDEQFRSSSLGALVRHLKDEIAELQEKLGSSYPKSEVREFLTTTFERGQLKGKQQVERAYGFGRPPEETPLFSKLKESYLSALMNNRAEGGYKKPLAASTLDDYDKSISLFISVMGDLHIGAIDEDLVGKYFGILKRLPASLNSAKAYRDKTIAEILAMTPPPPPQMEATCSKKIERISTMFIWATDPKRRRNWGIDVNPFTGFGQSGNTESTRRAFTDDELRALLNHPHFKRRSFTAKYMYWLIPLALYTGARLGELTLLDLKDFIVEEGIPCIDINDIDAAESILEGGIKKRVKTQNAKRLVPIHSELIRLGILRYVEQLKEKGEVHLFPEMSRLRKRGPRDTATTWFIAFRKKVGINSKQEAVFHSFRNTFITRTVDAGTPPHLIAPIVGHQTNLGITGNVYWGKRDAAKRAPTVEAFALSDDITGLLPTFEEVKFTAPRGPKPGSKRTPKT